MIFTDVVRERPGGTAVANGTAVDFFLDPEATPLTDPFTGLAVPSPTTTNGVFTLTYDGNPGLVYYEVSVGGETRRHTVQSAGPAAGAQLGELTYLFGAFQDGIVRYDREALSLTAGPGTREVLMGRGTIVGNGLQSTYHTLNRSLTFAANAGPGDRIDTVVGRFGLTGSGLLRKYQSKIVIVQGTAGGSFPTLTQTANDRDVIVGDVTVPQGATTIVAGNISTARRTYWEPVVSIPSPGATKMQVRRRESTGAVSVTASSNSNGQEISDVQESMTLVSGTVYDLFCLTWVYAKGHNNMDDSQQHIQTAVYIDDLADIRENSDQRWIGHDLDPGEHSGMYLPIVNTMHRTNVTGTGASITAGLRIRNGGSLNGSYTRALLHLIAIPR